MRITILLLFISGTVPGQTIQLKTNFAKNKLLQDNIDSIVLAKYAFRQSNPGSSILVVKDGEVIYKRNIGMANVEKNIPITDNTIFNIGSVTKQFTAFCILKLEEDGKLNLQDSIQKYIPELPNFDETITLNHLLSHTSGIPDYLEVLGLKNKFNKNRLQTDYMLNFFKKYHTLSFKPGERFSYSNTGYMMLRIIIERVSGTSINNYSNEQIFKPLKMHSAKFTYYEKDGMPDGTRSYYFSKNKFKAHKPIQPNAMGATGVFCNLEDYQKWDANFSHPTLKTKNIVAKMRQQYILNNGSKSGYGSGIIIKPYKGYISEEHSGGWNSFLVQFRRMPELGLSVFVASISIENKPFKICDEITDLFLPEKISSEPSFENSNINLNEENNLMGTYIDANNVVRKVKNNNGLICISNYTDTNKVIQKLKFLTSVGDSLIQFMDGNLDTLQFVKKDNKIKGFYWEGGTYFRFKRFYKKIELTDSKLASLNGKYRSNEMQYHFKIKSKEGNKLTLKPVFFKKYSLNYLGGNVFKTKNEPIYFRFYKGYVSVGNEWVSNLILSKN
jgi:CubicO group peptidase (beta-lactamase class C family)